MNFDLTHLFIVKNDTMDLSKMFLYRVESWTAVTSTGKTTKYCLVKLSFATHLIFSLASKDAFLTHAHPKGLWGFRVRVSFVQLYGRTSLVPLLMTLRRSPMPKNGQAFLSCRGDYQSFRWCYEAWPFFLGNIPRGGLMHKVAIWLSPSLSVMKLGQHGVCRLYLY